MYSCRMPVADGCDMLRKPQATYCGRQSYDALITSGPPHSTHLDRKPHQTHRVEIPWLVDMRDPWSDFQYNKETYQSRFARSIQARMEHKVLSQADVVISVSDYVGELLKGRGRIRRYHTILNGFDAADIPAETPAQQPDGPFVIAHVGTFNWARHSPGLVRALARLSGSAEIHFAGHVHERVVDAFKKAGVIVRLVPYMPHHDAVAYMQRADMLMVCVDQGPRNRGIVTGKAFEYISVNKPVLGIGPVDGDLAKILTHTEAGSMFDYEDAEGIFGYVGHYMDLRGQPFMVNEDALQSYERRELTGSLACILNSLT